MCNFFSLISNGEGKTKYFSHEQRLNKVAFEDGDTPDYDSHTAIAVYCGIRGIKEDEWNKWEYNPFTEKLVLDCQNTSDDREAVENHLREMDWTPMCGNIVEARKFLKDINDVHWFKNDGELPEDIKIFDTRGAARDAAWDAAWGAARDAAWDAAWDAARGAALLIAFLVCDGLVVDQRHHDHIAKRWGVWKAGYGVACDVNGEIYAYRKP